MVIFSFQFKTLKENREEQNINRNLIYQSIYPSNIEDIKNTLSQGANINYKYVCGSNALHLAIRNKKPKEFISFLIDNGININEENNEGNTPLIEACMSIHTDFKIIQLLIHHGANIDVKNKKEQSLLYILCMHSYKPKVLHFLIEKGLNPYEIMYGNNLLHTVCCHNPNYEMIKDLLNYIDVNQKNEQGKTAMELFTSDRIKHVHYVKIIHTMKRYGANNDDKIIMYWNDLFLKHCIPK